MTYNKWELYEEMGSGTGLEAIANYLNKDKYITDTPQDIDTKYNNPGLYYYFNFGYELTETGWKSTSDMTILKFCPEYLPSDDLISYLINLDSIIEVGAGMGYWSYVINKNGGDCLPTDIRPPDINMDNNFGFSKIEYYRNPEKYHFIDNNLDRNVDNYPMSFDSGRSLKVWSKVRIATHKVVKETDHKYVLLCHPPGNDWTEELLDIIKTQDKKLILVAEWMPSADATIPFFERLDRNWYLKEKFPIYDWETMNVSGYIFEPTI